MNTPEPMQPSLLDLLDLKYIFGQQSLLSANKFSEACKRRGIDWFTSEYLEALHRAEVVLPLYRIAKNTPRLQDIANRQSIPLGNVLKYALVHLAGNGTLLRSDRDAGYVHDPRAEKFVPWQRFMRQIDTYQVAMSEFVYSPYQLLLVPSIRKTIPWMKPRHTKSRTYAFRLVAPDHLVEQLHIQRKRNDDLILALSALERYYRPRIMQVVSLPYVGQAGEEAWNTFNTTFNPVALLAWLGWSADWVYNEAEHLLSQADDIDPLSEWLPLIRLCRPKKWELLRGDALIAMEHRIAAEMLLRFYEDLVKADAAPPLPDVPRLAPHPLYGRVKASDHDLDSVLMEFGLSPQPSLVLFLEGQTEEYILPKVLELLNIRWPRNYIEIQNAHSTQVNLGRIVSYMAPLAFGKTQEDFVELERPVTHFLAIFDPENAFAKKDTTQEKRKKWIDGLFNAAPAEYRVAALHNVLNDHIEVMTWEYGSFEFMHFTDSELRQAILSACQRLRIAVKDLPHWQVEDARARCRKIETVFPGKAKSHLGKIELARELWPILEHKIQTAIRSDSLMDIPIIRVVHAAMERANRVLRHDVILPLEPGETSV